MAELQLAIRNEDQAVSRPSLQLLNAMRSWWNGQMSGRECIEKVVTGLSEILLTFGGGALGTAAGHIGGPAGVVAGSAAGLAIGEKLGTMLAKKLKKWFFNRDNEQALKMAYKVLGVEKSATDAQVETAYRGKCREFHPDKLKGQEKKFLKVQSAHSLILASREG